MRPRHDGSRVELQNPLAPRLCEPVECLRQLLADAVSRDSRPRRPKIIWRPLVELELPGKELSKDFSDQELAVKRPVPATNRGFEQGLANLDPDEGWETIQAAGPGRISP